MAEIVKIIIEEYPSLSGLFNVSSIPISKFDLLNLFNLAFETNTKILSNDAMISNKNLISNKLFSTINMPIPNWRSMILQLKEDSNLNSKFYI
jgi:dTDP-4-dehydrorhamnose reductase